MPRTYEHVQFCVCKWPSTFPEICWSFSQSLWRFYSPTFYLKFWSVYYLLQLWFTPSGSYEVKQLPVCFWQLLPEKRFLELGKFQLKSNKDSLTRFSRKPPNRSSNDTHLRMGLRRHFNSVLSPPVMFRLLVFTTIWVAVF